MDPIEQQSQVPVPAKSTYGSQDLFTSPGETDNNLHLHMNSCHSTTAALGISTANLGPSADLNDQDPVAEYKGYANNAMGSSYNHNQGLQANLGYGAPYSMISDRRPLVGYQQLEPQSTFLSPQKAEMPNGAPPARGLQHLPKHTPGQNHWQYDSELDAMNDYGVQEQSDMLIGSNILLTHCNGLGTGFPAPQDGSVCHPRWNMPSLYETEVPPGAPSSSVPILPPTLWHMGTLVMDPPCSTA